MGPMLDKFELIVLVSLKQYQQLRIISPGEIWER